MARKYVYTFGGGKAEGDATMRNLLGGKGANLAEMNRIGIPVPAGLTISTEVCTYFYANNHSYPDGLARQVRQGLKRAERVMKARFGDAHHPLLVSVRSGARTSMPGMMDTVLNLGLNAKTVQGLIKATSDPRFAYDSYRRFVQMYADVVLGVDHHHFESRLQARKTATGRERDTDLTAEDWQELVGQYLEVVEQETGEPFPEEPEQQLWGAIGAVFRSWHTPRAITYRKLNGIPDHWGTAVNVQAMVYGNMGESSATGVCFTRDPGTGERLFYGEYLINAQGEDVVAGTRTPQQITLEGKEREKSDRAAMEESMPALYRELVANYRLLESHFRDMQDIEFTIQQNRLWILQTRNGKRTAQAAIRIAVEMAKEGLITKKEAVLRVNPQSLDQLLHPTLDPEAEKQWFATGLAASPGAASGEVVFTADDAEAMAQAGKSVILVREETSPEDIHGMHAAKGIVTVRGGTTSHAAVVARGMGRACVCGCGVIQIDLKKRTCRAGKTVLKEGDWITIDGSEGTIYVGRVPTRDPVLSEEFRTFMGWADQYRHLKVRANADTPHDALVAREFGAEGIGLCRTEHMFFDTERILAVREMILARDAEGRSQALAKLMPMQKGDFIGIFEAMCVGRRGLPVTIRLLDPPLHEFIPHEAKAQQEVAKSLGLELSEVQSRVSRLFETNPMLGHRGCRLGVSYPEIYEMQVRAIMEAAVSLVASGYTLMPEIMIPLVGYPSEFKYLELRCRAVAEQVLAGAGVSLHYTVGTMIELPRAALVADRIAADAEFFSFGTNDLTQTTLGISRDDAGSFLGEYAQKGILPSDPFASLDQEGVGQLVVLGTKRGRQTRPGLKVGVCGEHGGDPDSIHFFHRAGLDYVSCSPYRVPIARLAASQAVLAKVGGGKTKGRKG